MDTEKEKMLAGKYYDANDTQLREERINAKLLMKAFSDTSADQYEEKMKILKKLVPNGGDGLYIEPPFYCDYGSNIITGEKVYFNFNCVVLDGMRITIGNRALFGPNVQIYTACHPIDYEERAAGLEFSRPIIIGDDVWVGGSAVICPGVTIGDRCIIGAGSVVTKDIPSDTVAAGNPCKVIRSLTKK